MRVEQERARIEMRLHYELADGTKQSCLMVRQSDGSYQTAVPIQEGSVILSIVSETSNAR